MKYSANIQNDFNRFSTTRNRGTGDMAAPGKQLPADKVWVGLEAWEDDGATVFHLFFDGLRVAELSLEDLRDTAPAVVEVAENRHFELETLADERLGDAVRWNEHGMYLDADQFPSGLFPWEEAEGTPEFATDGDWATDAEPDVEFICPFCAAGEECAGLNALLARKQPEVDKGWSDFGPEVDHGCHLAAAPEVAENPGIRKGKS